MQTMMVNNGKVLTEQDFAALEIIKNKDVEIIMENKFNIEKYKDVTIIPPFVLNNVEEVEETKEEYWKVLKNLFIASMKESGLPIDELDVTVVKKIRFMIEDKFVIEGLIPIIILPIYEMKNGQVISENYTIDEFNVDLALELQSPIKEDNGDINMTYTYSMLMQRLKEVFRGRVFMFYSDVKAKGSIIYDFEKYIDTTFLMSNIMKYALLGYDTIEYRKMGNIIQIILRNEENFEIHSEINNHEINTIRKKYYDNETFKQDRFFDMEYDE